LAQGLLLLTFVLACAFDIVHVKQVPLKLEPTQISKSSFELEKEITFGLGTGFTRTLRAGTRWHYVGKVSYGDIFKTYDQILTVEASNIYEAYIVVSSRKLVGFYLPVEHSFSPLNKPIGLAMREFTPNP